MTRVLAFDVDGTLDAGGGPIPVLAFRELNTKGYKIYVVSDSWPKIPEELRTEFTIFCPLQTPRAERLRQIAALEKPEVKVYIGDSDDDRRVAMQAEWEFIPASKFGVLEV